MKKQQTENEIHYYIEDANIYTLWKLAQPAFCSPDFSHFYDISPLRYYEYNRVFSFIKTRLEMSGVQLNNVGFSDNNPERKKFPPKEEDLKDLTKQDKAAVLKTYKKLDNEDGTLDDVEKLAAVYNDFYSSIYFLPQTDPKVSKAIFSQLDDYIDRFLNRELFVYNRNYWIFEKQKEHFISRLRKERSLENFGANFIISERIPSAFNQNEEFLFVHTLCALQKLGYIKVIRLWHVFEGDYQSVYKFHANVLALEPLVQEVNSSYRKDNPALLFEKYDDNKTTIHFAGKAIEISKKNKENDAVALMRVLVRELDKDKERYWYEDEIAELTGNDPDDIRGKNKYYYAARSINDAIQIAAGVDDFIDRTTTKFRVNPKYLKS